MTLDKFMKALLLLVLGEMTIETVAFITCPLWWWIL